ARGTFRKTLVCRARRPGGASPAPTAPKRRVLLLPRGARAFEQAGDLRLVGLQGQRARQQPLDLLTVREARLEEREVVECFRGRRLCLEAREGREGATAVLRAMQEERSLARDRLVL